MTIIEKDFKIIKSKGNFYDLYILEKEEFKLLSKGIPIETCLRVVVDNKILSRMKGKELTLSEAIDTINEEVYKLKQIIHGIKE